MLFKELREEKQMMQRQFDRDDSHAKWEKITIIFKIIDLI